MNKYLLSFFIFFILSFITHSQHLHLAGQHDNSKQGYITRYEKFEIKIDTLCDSTGRIFDYLHNEGAMYNGDSIQLWADFLSPTGKTFHVPGFYYKAYKPGVIGGQSMMCDTTGKDNILSDSANSRWCIRFAPREEGTWFYRIYALNVYGSSNTLYGKFTSVAEGGQKGFVSLKDKRYLKYDNGEPYYPVGQNYGWTGVKDKLYCEFRDQLDSFAANGKNFWRHLSGLSYGFTIDAFNWQENKNFYPVYASKITYILDTLIRFCENNGIYIQYHLFDDHQFNNCVNCWDNWAFNNYRDSISSAGITYHDPNGIHTQNEFFNFSNTHAVKRSKDYLRYCMARYGYSKSVALWEIMGEFDHVIDTGWSHTNATVSDMKKWHDSVYTWTKQLDWYKRLISTGMTGEIPDGDPNTFLTGNKAAYDLFARTMDYTQSHSYTYDNLDSMSIYYIAHQKQLYIDGDHYIEHFPDKPYFADEAGWFPGGGGLNHLQDTNGFDVHNSVLMSLFTGAMGSNCYWNFGYIRDCHLHKHWQPVSNFIKNSHLSLSQNFQHPEIFDPSNITAYALSNSIRSVPGVGPYEFGDTIVGWVQDFNYRIDQLYANHRDYLLKDSISDKPSGIGIITLGISLKSALSGKTFSVDWYDGETGNYNQTTSATASGTSLTISSPSGILDGKYGDAVFVARVNHCPTTLLADYTVSLTTETWSTPQYINNNVIVPAGKTLKIQADCYFAPTAKIIVQGGDILHPAPGAGTLIVDGVTLKGGGCFNKTWGGIRVSGNSPTQLTQSDPKTGKVIIHAGSVIQDADTAVESNLGGIIDVVGTTFMNCSTAFYIHDYTLNKNQWSNASRIDSCNMIWTEQIYNSPPNSYGTMVSLKNVCGIYLGGCNMMNNDPTVFSNPKQRGQAVYSENAITGIGAANPANYTDSCITYNGRQTTISGFYCGVHDTVNVSRATGLQLKETRFYNNLYSLVSQNDSSLKLSESTFAYENRIAHFPDSITKGFITSDGSKSVRIYHNGFMLRSDSGYFIKINNSFSGAENCIIHGNAFLDSLSGVGNVTGNWFLGDNSTLGITCNMYRGCTTDWLIDSPSNLMSPQGYFGNSALSARNSFDSFPIGSTHQNILNRSSNNLNYNYSPTDISSVPYPIPVNRTGTNVFLQQKPDPGICDTLNCNGYRVGIAELTNSFSGHVSLYPNPSLDGINLLRSDYSQLWRLEVSDIQGRVVYQNNWYAGQEQLYISASQIGTGLYFFRVYNKNQIQEAFGKFVIENY